MITIENLEKSFQFGSGEDKVLDQVNLSLNSGEITALNGVSGSGKSTLLTIIAGLQNATNGKIVVDGVELTNLKESELRQRRASQFGFIFQQSHLIPFLSVKDQLAFMIETAGRKWSRKEREEKIDAMLEAVDMMKHKDSNPNNLSGGEKQRVAIARALIHEPEVLFADEVTASLDSKRSTQVMEIIRNIAQTRKITVLMVTHDEDMLQYADRVVTMKDRKIIDA
ncbi:ABC transporter ATP-binding protein [Aliicoccus persicus]|uniref:Putative hemin import ATP-binding protein HrtA n=1 Tax=Aliicoccus persicus TaxID=930138 RepID=A0A662Z5Q6_9STAP|nr:ABC transporter ATP-binding protein [Aliicoccus persicus]SEV93105.1 putative ABC transport system ATP-binding protein [Aliicoccus persicus]